MLVDEDPTVVSRMTVTCPFTRSNRPACAYPRTGVPWIWSPACLGLHRLDRAPCGQGHGGGARRLSVTSIIEGQEEPIVSGGRSNHPQHALRMDAMVAAMDVLEGELLLNQDADAEGWLMGAVVDPPPSMWADTASVLAWP